MILIYCRISTLGQNKPTKGESSIEEQERHCRAIAELRGAKTYDVVKYADVGVSGSIPLHNRRQGYQMLQEAQAGDTIIAKKLDRMFRSTLDALQTLENMKKREIDVILSDLGSEPVTGNGLGKIVFTLMAMFADFERERIAARVADGRGAKRQKNGHVGGAPPYGFRVVGEGRQAVLEPEETEQNTMALIREMVQHATPSYVAKQLTERGIMSRAGTPFQIAQVQKYAGRYVRH